VINRLSQSQAGRRNPTPMAQRSLNRWLKGLAIPTSRQCRSWTAFNDARRPSSLGSVRSSNSPGKQLGSLQQPLRQSLAPVGLNQHHQVAQLASDPSLTVRNRILEVGIWSLSAPGRVRFFTASIRKRPSQGSPLAPCIVPQGLPKGPAPRRLLRRSRMPWNVRRSLMVTQDIGNQA